MSTNLIDLRLEARNAGDGNTDKDGSILPATFFEEDWLVDRAERADPMRLTELFDSSVPVLKFLEWKVTDTDGGFAECVLPLNVNLTNQPSTHQAAIILIAADYIGGIALGTLLDRVPLVGIHPLKTDYGAYLWGAKADVQWIRPSTHDLICTAHAGLGVSYLAFPGCYRCSERGTAETAFRKFSAGC